VKQYLGSLDFYFWIATLILQLSLAISALRRGAAKWAPRYFAYLVFCTLFQAGMFLTAQLLPYAVYVEAYFTGTLVSSVLLALVVYDIFRLAFDPLTSLPPRFLARLGASVVFFGGGATALAFWRPAISLNAFFALCRTFERTSYTIVALSLWCVVMYARSLGIPWKSRIAGIAQGFLLYLSVESIRVAIFGFAPQSWFAPLDWIARLAYAGTVLIWLGAVRRPEEVAAQLPTPEGLLSLRSWLMQMRTQTNKLEVAAQTKWSEE
jgi:hypothetical protein